MGLQIEKLKQQAKEKEMELLALLALTPIQIWQTDLDAFLIRWKVRPPSPSLVSEVDEHVIANLRGLGGQALRC